jgi:hypothetical protein
MGDEERESIDVGDWVTVEGADWYPARVLMLVGIPPREAWVDHAYGCHEGFRYVRANFGGLCYTDHALNVYPIERLRKVEGAELEALLPPVSPAAAGQDSG